MDITGVLLKKSEVQEKTEKFKIQEFYLDCTRYDQYTGERYENIIKFQVTNANIEKLQAVQEGYIVKVSFFPTGRFFDYQGEKKHAQNLNAYQVDFINRPESPTTKQEQIQATMQVYNTQENETDDLPF